MTHALQVELWLDTTHENHGKHDADALKEIFAPIFTDKHPESVVQSGLYGADGELFIMQIEASEDSYALFLKNRKAIIDIYGSQFNRDDYGVIRIEIEDFAEMQKQFMKAFEDMAWD